MEKLQPPKEHANFDFDSTDQLEGLLALKYWLRHKKSSDSVRDIDLFFIQKDHDAHIYWQEFMATQISDLKGQIVLLQREISELKRVKRSYGPIPESRIQLLASKAKEYLGK